MGELPIYGAKNGNETKCDTNATLLHEFLELNRFVVQKLVIVLAKPFTPIFTEKCKRWMKMEYMVSQGV